MSATDNNGAFQVRTGEHSSRGQETRVIVITLLQLTSCVTLGKDVSFPLWASAPKWKTEMFGWSRIRLLLLTFCKMLMRSMGLHLRSIRSANLQSPLPDRTNTFIYFGKEVIDWPWRFVAFRIKSQELIWYLYKLMQN